MSFLCLRASVRPTDVVWDDNEQPMRAAVEAHILARESNEEIAYRNGCGAEIIEAYEAVFFNVREKLNHREYIVNVVIGERLQTGLTNLAYELLWKLLGYFHGPHMLDAMVGKLVNPQWANNPEDVPACLQDTALNLMKKQAALAALNRNVPASRTDIY